MKQSDIEVTYIGGYGDDKTVANAARVSFAKEASNYSDEQNSNLLRYLAKHGHHSPFNHAFLSFRIKAPIFVARQLVKHKFMPWNEVSRRYVDDEPEFYFPEYRERANNIKQGSGAVGPLSWQKEADYYTTGITQLCLENYQDLLTLGVSPEQARMVLPQNTMTEWVWSGTLGAFLDMLKLRLDEHTQYETRIVAMKIAEVVEKIFRVSFEMNINGT